MSKPTVAIIGAGAVGAFYGAKLQKAGHPVEFQSRYLSEHMQGNILMVKSAWGDFSLPVKVCSDVAEMQPADLVIIATKYLPEIDFVKLVKPVVKSNSYIVCLQNGINQEEKLAAFFTTQVITGALAFTCINREGPNQVNHLDYGMLKMARLDGGAMSEIAHWFSEAGIKNETGSSLRLFRWQKLLWNVPFNSLSILAGTTDKIMASRPLVELSRALMVEVQRLAAAEGIIIEDSEIDDMLNRTQRMKPYKTSMMLDYLDKKPIELEAILGELLQVSESVGIEIKHIKTLYNILSFLDQVNRE